LNNPHPYLPNSVKEIKQKMLSEMGLKSVEDLYSDVPEKVRLKGKLDLEGPYSEFEVRKISESILKKNRTIKDMPTFLGGGIWPHYVPAVVDEITNRTELITSYTPYQPEISQGILQSLFEYQSLMCELTEMEVCNCSMYDWASALGEAARLVSRVTRRNEFIVPQLIHPERYMTLRTYVDPVGIKVVQVKNNKESGQIDLSDLESKISSNTAGVYLENPSYLGYMADNADKIAEISHKVGAKFVVGVDPTSLGIFKAPGQYETDVVIGEGQPLGLPMSFGGPLLGIFACRNDSAIIRQMPGRIVGMTTTQDGLQSGYCMTLSTREQHIRREKATSNICSNESLCAVAAATYMALLGPTGLKNLSETILYKSNYAMKKISRIKGIKAPLFNAPHFKEFVVKYEKPGKTAIDIHRSLLKNGIHGGKILSKEFPELGETALYCVTEIHSKEEIDKLTEQIALAME
jgi:glycine dehydrogenase subunit 1